MHSSRTRLDTPFKVAIVGGSIAGCACAIELARIGCQVSLFERSGDELKDRGAGISIPAAVVETLKCRDLVDSDIACFPSRSISRLWRTAADARYGYLAWEQSTRLTALNWGGLYRALRSRVSDADYHQHHTVSALHYDDREHAAVEFVDGRRATYDLVVCADGYASLGRRTLFPAVDFDYAGYILWRGAIAEHQLSEPEPLAHGVSCTGFAGGHGIFYLVPGVDGAVARGQRLVNWGVYEQLDVSQLATFMTDHRGRQQRHSLPPGGMPIATENTLKARADEQLPEYYAEITRRSKRTFAYAIYDCEVPAYRRGRVCLVGDAGAFSRPHSGAGALKGINDAISLAGALLEHPRPDEALQYWSDERTEANNTLVRYGNQLGRALVEEIPDWSQMDSQAMQLWFNSIVTIPSGYILNRSQA